jgi:hypothetical protein
LAIKTGFLAEIRESHFNFSEWTVTKDDMNKFCFFVFLLALLSLSACSSSSPIVNFDTAVAGTQAAIPTPTLYPTYTPLPTYTPFPPTPYPTKIQYQESFSIRLFPGSEANLIYTSETGTEFWLEFPKDATLQPARVMIIPGLSTIYSSDLVFHGDAFDLLAGLGDQMEGFKQYSFNAPISVSIKFATMSQPLEKLALYYWTGSNWEKVEIVCNLPLPSLDAKTNTIKTYICSPGTYAIFSPSGN